MQEANERSKREHCFDGATEIYITGPSWPSAATVNVNDVNPWSQHWNLTHQGQIYKRDRDKAMRMAQAAGPLSARRENAK
jgi:hypothetical protein